MTSAGPSVAGHVHWQTPNLMPPHLAAWAQGTGTTRPSLSEIAACVPTQGRSHSVLVGGQRPKGAIEIQARVPEPGGSEELRQQQAPRHHLSRPEVRYECEHFVSGKAGERHPSLAFHTFI